MNFEKLQIKPADKERDKFREAEQESRKEMTRGANESQVSYLQRMGALITREIKGRQGLLFDPNRTQENDLPESVRGMIDEIMIEALKPHENAFDLSKNEDVIKSVDKAVGFHDKGNSADSESFDRTQRNRKFFEIQPGKGSAKRETYWNTLFFPYNTETTREFAKQALADKRIVLLGGGRSQLKNELQENNIAPREIVNIDPFVENIDDGADTVIPLSASDENFSKKMLEQNIESADEIWAEYSVPAYLESPEEIRQLIQNIDALLAEGGSARIWPIQVSGRGENSDLTARKDALMESLTNLGATNKYEIVLYESAGRPGLILHKIKSQIETAKE